MQLVKKLEVTLLNLLGTLCRHTRYVVHNELHDDRDALVLREHILLELVVNHLALRRAPVLGIELSTAGGVSDGQLDSVSQLEAATVADCYARLDHDQVDNFGVRINLKVALFGDSDESLQQGVARYSELGEFEVPVVKAVVTKLGTAVAYFDTWKRLEALRVTHRHNERLHAVIVLQGDASCENDGVRGLDSKIAGPELRSFDCRRMNDKLVRVGVESRSCLNSCHIRPVAELCLSVTADDLPVVQKG